MNKQLTKIDEMIDWLDANAPEDACVVLLAMSEQPLAEGQTADERRMETRSFMEGYDAALADMLVKKLTLIPLLKQIFTEALGRLGVKIEPEALLKWRDKVKYDLHFDLEELPTEEQPTLPGEPEPYIAKMQEFAAWMSEKPSRNLTVLALAQDDLNSPRTTLAMGFAPDLVVLLEREMRENYGLQTVVEAALYTLETRAGYEEYTAWKEGKKK
jgi:hypothetical protein